jgi:hypothetical protein
MDPQLTTTIDMASQQPPHMFHAAHGDEDVQKHQTDVVPLDPSVVVGGAHRHCDDRPAASRSRYEDSLGVESQPP